MAFTTIPVRATGRTTGRVGASWFNTLRTAILELQAFFGAGAIPTTLFTLANNQSSAADVTGALFAGGSYRTAVVHVDIMRKTATASSEVRASGRVTMFYNTQDSVWRTEPVEQLDGDFTGVTFSVTTAGQLQYTTTDLAGSSYVGELYYSAETTTR